MMQPMTTLREAPLSAFSDLLSFISGSYPPEVREVLEAELPELKRQALRLALEIETAETQGLMYVDAVKRPMSFPLMTKLHHGAVAMLQYELPPEAVAHLRHFVESLVTRDSSDVWRAVMAAMAAQTIEGALLRFVVYQATRIERWLRAWALPAVEASGALARIDRDAQQTLEHWLSQSSSLPSDVSVMKLVDAEIMVRLQVLSEERADELRALQVDAMDHFQAMVAAVTIARELSIEDAIVVRNEYQEELGEQRLASAELADMYPDQFPSANAVDQRAHRVRTAIANRALPFRGDRPRLLDFFRALASETESK